LSVAMLSVGTTVLAFSALAASPQAATAGASPGNATSMVQEYDNTLRDTDSLKLYLDQLRAQLKSQQDEMASIQAEQNNVASVKVAVLPLMQQMLDTLGQFVNLDLPFLVDERHNRIKQLNDMMPQADVTVAEKFRRIVEAYQIEIDYGRNVDSFAGTLNGKAVAFLRIGRVALLYQTPDGKETGYWERDKKGWVADNSYADGVKEGLKVARKQTSPDLLIVPIPAAQTDVPVAAPAAVAQ
jgi:hypothetical protein